MKLTYSRLIDVHGQIEGLANQLLAELQRAGSAASDLAHRLNALQFVVDEHLATEKHIAEACGSLRLASSWSEMLRQGRDDFARLRADWSVLLSGWNEELIEADREGFHRA